MNTKRKARKDVDVGASKAFKGILGSLDRRLVEPAGILVRFWGWALLVAIAYLFFFEMFREPERRAVIGWLVFYACYLTVLEIGRKTLSHRYDSSIFRAVRILFNLLAISILIRITSSVRFLLVFAYTFPISATIVYFPKRNPIKVGIFLLAVLGLYLASIPFAVGDPLSFVQFTVLTLALAIFSYVFEIFRRRVSLIPGRLTELAKELHKTLDLQQLMMEILENAVEISLAQRGLIIVINPRNKRYVGHNLYNFELRADRSIEDLARKCYVLVHGQRFASKDIIAAFKDRTIYHEFFDSQPRSVIAEPLFNRAGQVMGVINVAHNNPNAFDNISRKLLREFAFLVSSAIENCLENRELKLREAKSREVGEKFVSASTEDEVVHVLIGEVLLQIPHTEKLTLHRYMKESEKLLPIYNLSPETTPKFLVWSSPRPRGIKPDLRLGYGIAGHALELRDTILVTDVDSHPWYVKLDHAPGIKTLLVAPLFDPKHNELYGTVSLESSKGSAFNLDDESVLTNLSTQASRAIAKQKDFQAWREHGGILRRILEQIQAYDLSAPEQGILQQIADAATKILGYKIARVRILDERGQLVTKAVSGVMEKTRQKLMEIDIPYNELQPFLRETSKAESSYLIKHGDSVWKQFVDRYLYVPQRTMNKKQGWHAYDALITPICDSSGNTLGILTLDQPNTGLDPNQQVLESIGVFASSAGWMIELNRFQNRLTDQQHRTQSFINTISHELAKCRDLTTICEVVVQVGTKLLSAEGCSLYLVHGNEIELARSNYLANTEYISRRKPISSRPKSGLTAWVADTGESLCFNSESYKQHEAWAEEIDQLHFLPSKKCLSLLLSPVKDAKDNVIGVISLENKTTLAGPKDFDEEDIERLDHLAEELARAIELIGLFDDIREWERTGLAEDIHDLINWHHSGIAIWSEAIEEWLKRGDYQKVKELVTPLRQHAFTFVQELKTLHTNFLTKSFEEPTLKKALEQTLLAWTKRMIPKYEKQKMRISFNCPEDLEIPIKIRNTIIRFASLAFSNAIQHSGITEDPKIEVWVRVEQKDQKIMLTVGDNGRGIDHERNPPGFGLDRMKQLVEKINYWGEVQAKFQIRTKINGGTRVILSLTTKNTF